MTDTATDITVPDDRPPRRHAWTETEPRPWRRFLARMLDTSLFGMLALMLIGAALALTIGPDQTEAVAGQLDGGLGRFLNGIVMVVTAAPLIALSIAWSGGTPGKWLMGVRVQRPDGRRLGILTALRREAVVACIGLGLGAPLISLFFLNTARQHLEQNGEADWDDEDRSVVVHRPDGVFQTILTVIGAALVIGVWLWGVISSVAGSMS